MGAPGTAITRLNDIGTASSGGTPDPSQLPEATGQAPSDWDFLGGLSVGTSDTDPDSGVTVMRLTDNTTPGAGSHNTSYPTGGPSISQSWESGGVTYYTAYLNGWLVDIRYDTLATSNWRSAPTSGETNLAFSMNPSTPQICFYSTGTSIVRYDTATDSAAPSGIFPYTISASGSAFAWLQSQYNDTWLVGMYNSNTTYVAVRTSDGTERSLTTAETGLTHDELHLDLVDAFAYLSVDETADANAAWDLVNDTLDADPPVACTGGGNMSDDHATPMRGGMAGDVGGGSPWGGAFVYIRADDEATRIRAGWANWKANNADTYNTGHGNLFGFGGSTGTFDEQWFIGDKFINDDAAWDIRDGVIGMVKADGSDIRYVCAHCTSGGAYDYYTRPNWSPDGKLLFWTSDMNASGRYDVFVCKLPTT